MKHKATSQVLDKRLVSRFAVYVACFGYFDAGM